MTKKPPSSDSPLYRPSLYRFHCQGKYSATSRTPNSSGRCVGLVSRMELLLDLPVTTRSGAVKEFTNQKNYQVEDETGDSLSETTKSLVLTPALVYRDNQDPLPDDEMINYQKWSCYGSTEVDFLVLTDTKTGAQRIEAVSPLCGGLSVRRIQGSMGSATSVTIGSLNIVLETPDQRPDEAQYPEEVPPKPSVDTLTSAREAMVNFYHFTGKVGEHMAANVSFLKDTLQDDFANRCWASGNRILERVPVTVDLTYKYMKKLSDKWLGD